MLTKKESRIEKNIKHTQATQKIYVVHLRPQNSRMSRMVDELARAQIQDGYVSYPWERRMQESLPVPNSSCFLSMLLLPKASDRVVSRYNDLEDTLARANAWLNASQASGVPIVFMNIQTESLLTKISGETASSTVNAGSLSDLSNLANASLYGFEDYHGVDIGVVRAVRLWYSPLGGEVSFEIKLKESDTKLGFAISRTEEGFIYISSVIDSDDNAPSTRSGLSNLYNEATRASKLLVVSRVSNQKVLPWIVSPTGAVRCFDTVSLSQKLSLHRHARVPILLHVFLWDRDLASTTGSNTRFRATSPSVLPLPPEIQLVHLPNENQFVPLPSEVPSGSEVLDDRTENRLDRDTAGEFSFRLHDFSLPNNWTADHVSDVNLPIRHNRNVKMGEEGVGQFVWSFAPTLVEPLTSGRGGNKDGFSGGGGGGKVGLWWLWQQCGGGLVVIEVVVVVTMVVVTTSIVHSRVVVVVVVVVVVGGGGSGGGCGGNGGCSCGGSGSDNGNEVVVVVAIGWWLWHLRW
ncbi:hypothetical protein TEA_010903 [Camellia sinensis var. sinensis]|uniref:Uncharacterized protein n=1 Tax=Camellia sinensis var. sinensis TaxID=542762 RepID=A0A4S4DA61_CAMSN|nr:hypothetical protein TEA_010903 [Camellia sinensis var. sinensis]